MPVSGESDQGRPRRRLGRLVASFLGVPRPGHYERQQVLQDTLLPKFLDNSRLSWLLAEPPQAELKCVDTALKDATQEAGDQIKQLKVVLEEMRVLDLLEAVADSPDLAVLRELRLESEIRLLNFAGHPRASDEFPALMRKVIANPTILAEARQRLDQAAEETLKANRHIAQLQQQPKKRKLFGGLGSLFSGLVLLAGDGAVPIIGAPVFGPLAYLPVIGSFAAGIAAVGKGVGDLNREGEELEPTQGPSAPGIQANFR